MNTNTPAGWYQTPNDPSTVTFWDGSKWTNAVQAADGPPPPADTDPYAGLQWVDGKWVDASGTPVKPPKQKGASKRWSPAKIILAVILCVIAFWGAYSCSTALNKVKAPDPNACVSAQPTSNTDAFEQGVSNGYNGCP